MNIPSNIDLITDKIYQEGLERAQKEAEKIINEARVEADQLIEDARQQASDMVEQAKKEAETTERNALSEIKLSGDQAIVTLKNKIKALLNDKIVDQPVKQLFSDQQFLKELILTIAKHSDNPDEAGLMLPEQVKTAMDDAMISSLKKEVNGMTINFDQKLKGGFQIHYKDKGYIITFTDEDFVEFFKPFLNDKTAELLFK